MSKIFYLMGKSCTGKDTIYKNLCNKYSDSLYKIVMYTTRPMRSGEKEGREYFFVNEEKYQELEKENKVIESRVYNTIHGPWRYFTVNDNQFSKDNRDHIMIGVLDSFLATRDFFGKDCVIPIYIDLDDGVRLQRALDREKNQENPKYKEMCRRYISDSEDFSEDKISNAGIEKRFLNNNLEECINEICSYIDNNRRD